MSGFKEIEVFPLLHLGDPPAPGEDASEAGRALGHDAASISLAARRRL
jgi:hypothetical protein